MLPLAADPERAADEIHPVETPGEMVALADAQAFFAAAPDRRAGYTEQEGGVSIEHKGARRAWADTLFWLAPRPCFGAVRQVLDEGAARVPLFASVGAVTMTRTGDEIEIASDVTEPARFPALPLLGALTEAGSALVAEAGPLWAQDEAARTALPHLEEEARLTRERLAGARAGC